MGYLTYINWLAGYLPSNHRLAYPILFTDVWYMSVTKPPQVWEAMSCVLDCPDVDPPVGIEAWLSRKTSGKGGFLTIVE